MTTGEVIAAIAIGVGVGGLALALRRKETPAPPKSDGGKDPCDALAAVGPEAVAACKGLKGFGSIIQGVADLLDGPDWAKRDEKNRALNGEVELPLGALDERSWCATKTMPLARHRYLHGTVARFSNGCVPFEGAAGWEACAPGTEDMHSSCGGSTEGQRVRTPLDGGAEHDPDHPDKVIGTPALNHAFSTGAHDPMTAGPFRPGGTDYMLEYGATQRRPSKFALPIGPGQLGWIVAGKPMVCPADQVPAKIRDHRAGGGEVTVCKTPGPATPPDRMPSDWEEHEHEQFDATKFCRDPSTGQLIRKAVGQETRADGTCGPAPKPTVTGVWR